MRLLVHDCGLVSKLYCGSAVRLGALPYVAAVLWIGCKVGSTAICSCCTVDWLQGWQHYLT